MTGMHRAVGCAVHGVALGGDVVHRDAAGHSRGSLIVTLLCCVALLMLSVYAGFLWISSQNQVMAESYMILCLEGVLFAVLLLLKYGHSGIYIFEPFSIVTLAMVLVYFVAPVFQFAAGSTSRYGVDVSRYCLSATTLVIAGYLSFFIAYEFKFRSLPSKKGRKKDYIEIEQPIAHQLVKWAYILWVGAYLLNLFYYLSRGFDIVYVISGGLTGAEDNSLQEDTLAFLAYTKFIMLGSWMMLYAYGRNRAAKTILYILTLLCMFLSGGRLTLMIALLAPITFSFAMRRESPRFVSIVVCLALFISLFAFMQVARVGLRSGLGLDMSDVSIEELINPFYAEIDDFKSYYILLGVVPEKHDYLLGSQMFFYSLVLLIPRAVWPDKPSPEVHELVYLSFGSQSVANGNAYPAIGEYYVEFGVVGVIVLMFALGVVCRMLKACYERTRGKSIGMMVYALVYPTLLSIVIRGYFPQNFSMLLFMLAPLLLFSLLSHSQKKNALRGEGGR